MKNDEFVSKNRDFSRFRSLYASVGAPSTPDAFLRMILWLEMIFREKKSERGISSCKKTSNEVGTIVAYGRLWSPMVAYGIRDISSNTEKTNCVFVGRNPKCAPDPTPRPFYVMIRSFGGGTTVICDHEFSSTGAYMCACGRLWDHRRP